MTGVIAHEMTKKTAGLLVKKCRWNRKGRRGARPGWGEDSYREDE